MVFNNIKATLDNIYLKLSRLRVRKINTIVKDSAGTQARYVQTFDKTNNYWTGTDEELGQQWHCFNLSNEPFNAAIVEKKYTSVIVVNSTSIKRVIINNDSSNDYYCNVHYKLIRGTSVSQNHLSFYSSASGGELVIAVNPQSGDFYDITIYNAFGNPLFQEHYEIKLGDIPSGNGGYCAIR